MTDVLRFENVTKVFGEGDRPFTALHETSFVVKAGEMVAVMGPSGSGKSTLLTIAGGLETPTTGRVQVHGTEISELSSDKRADFRIRSIGYVFQELNLLGALTAIENVSLPLELDGMSTRKAAEAANEVLSRVGLSDRATMFPDDLSGGERQRVAIARALLSNPKSSNPRLLLADEPTGALDSTNGEGIMRLMSEACGAGATVMFVTHDAQLAAWADRIVFLRDGRIVDTSTGLDDCVLSDAS